MCRNYFGHRLTDEEEHEDEYFLQEEEDTWGGGEEERVSYDPYYWYRYNGVSERDFR